MYGKELDEIQTNYYGTDGDSTMTESLFEITGGRICEFSLNR